MLVTQDLISKKEKRLKVLATHFIWVHLWWNRHHGNKDGPEFNSTKNVGTACFHNLRFVALKTKAHELEATSSIHKEDHRRSYTRRCPFSTPQQHVLSQNGTSRSWKCRDAVGLRRSVTLCYVNNVECRTCLPLVLQTKHTRPLAFLPLSVPHFVYISFPLDPMKGLKWPIYTIRILRGGAAVATQ